MKSAAITLFTLLGAGLTGFAETAEEIEARYVEALGGEERLAEIETMEIRGSTQLMAGTDPAPLVIRTEKPHHYWMSIELPAGEVIQLYDGEKAWFRTVLPDDPGEWMPMEESEAVELRNLAWEAAHLNALVPMPGRTLALAEDGQGLVVDYPSGTARKRWFNEEGLLIRETSIEGDTEFEAFTEFGGIPFATEITTPKAGGPLTTQIEEVLINPGFAPDQFVAGD